MVSEAQKRATKKWTMENMKRIPLNVRNEEYQQIKQFCDDRNIPVNTFIKECIKRGMIEDDATISELIGSENLVTINRLLQAENRDFKAFINDVVNRYLSDRG